MSVKGSMSQYWLKATLHRSPLAWLLLPVTATYTILWWCRCWLWRIPWRSTERLAVPVVVVGNVVVGGAGKTPATLAVLHHLVDAGFSPAVVSRGYGRNSRGIIEVTPQSPAHISGDEPLLIRQASGVPVFVGEDRASTGRQLLQTHPQVNVIVCDDGLQHWHLHRDIAIAVFDERGLGNGWLLPSGLLREPWPMRHRFAPDLVLLQHSPPNAPPPLFNPQQLPVFTAQRRLSSLISNLLGQQRSPLSAQQVEYSAISGIAQPERFFNMIQGVGFRLTGTVALPDHAPAAAWTAVLAKTPGEVLCTEKDAVKLRGLLSEEDASRVWVAGLELDVPNDFMQEISQRLRAIGRV